MRLGWGISLLKPRFSSNKNAHSNTKTSVGRMLQIIIPERSCLFLLVYNKAVSTPTLNLGKRQIISVYLTIFFSKSGGNAQWKAALISNQECRNVDQVTFYRANSMFPRPRQTCPDFKHSGFFPCKDLEKKKFHSAETFLPDNMFGWVLLSIIHELSSYLTGSVEPRLSHGARPFRKLVLFYTIMQDAVATSIKFCLYK